MNEKMIKEIKDIIIPESCICVHGITKSSDVILSSKNILKSGLNNYYRGGLSSNCTIFGQLETIDFQKILNYSYYKDENNFYGNIIIAIPNVMSDIYGNRYFIGSFEDYYLGNNDEKILKACKHPFNAWINDTKIINNGFIVGSYIKNKENDINYFILNENYIGLKTENDRRIFFENIKQDLSRYGLKNLDEGYIYLNKKSFYGQSLINYLKKEKDKETIKKII